MHVNFPSDIYISSLRDIEASVDRSEDFKEYIAGGTCLMIFLLPLSALCLLKFNTSCSIVSVHIGATLRKQHSILNIVILF